MHASQLTNHITLSQYSNEWISEWRGVHTAYDVVPTKVRRNRLLRFTTYYVVYVVWMPPTLCTRSIRTTTDDVVRSVNAPWAAEFNVPFTHNKSFRGAKLPTTKPVFYLDPLGTFTPSFQPTPPDHGHKSHPSSVISFWHTNSTAAVCEMSSSYLKMRFSAALHSDSLGELSYMLTRTEHELLGTHIVADCW